MLDKLEMFIALAREAHFGRAAASLGITQPTLSTGIKQLEDQLGVQLVFRASRFGGLTPEGQTALVWARKIVGDARQLREEMRFKREGLSGQLRLAVIPTALTWVARLASEFGKKHPNVRFTILSRTSVEILSMLDNLEIDAGISYLDNEPMGRVSTEPLYEERYMLVCARSSPFSKRDSVGWNEIGGARLSLLTPDMQNRRIINRNFAAVDTTPETWIESNSTIVLAAMVERGDSLTILPEDMAEFLAQRRSFALVPLHGPEPAHSVGLVAPYREPHTPVLDALMRTARNMSKSGR
ncbi:MAG TPA: LysR family transcriptional regulator [Amaricoccus sp.]|uniref:LysR family transcriptional regulator n=1 Tax=Amaricoccus sp. TaxID=1872485 RepID=UPI002C8D8F92|nr:LysR family transcriptional regulator [Amaricoccus sp.]HMQ94769.1 LysR family transcriptional regulator [Amaricoccus sp.]HMR37584.1 LysR family transcriptional regulator [Paracoccus sp. (in: a-proteobacteria)]HMR53282.1 LysR family transcriptional regulator [Amaricoccus sp.]HMU00255.1 LysR family transcriptional regulator [Amaricoccus sp.]